MLRLAREVLCALPDISLFLFDHDLRYLFCEGSSLRLNGFAPEEMEGLTLRDVLGAGADELEPMYRRALAGETLEFETGRGERRYSVRAAPTRDDAGRIVGGSLLSIDVTERELASQATLDGAARVDRIAANLPGVVYQVRLDAEGAATYPYVSEGIREIAGIAPADLQADPGLLARMIHPDDLEGFIHEMAGRSRHDEIARWEGRIVRGDGGIRWLAMTSQPQPVAADGSTTRDGVAIDVTRQHDAEDTARWRLYHDQLTTLPNRLLFRERLDEEIERARAGNHAVGVCFIDLDRFEQTNAMLGQAAADEVLCVLARRIRGVVRAQDIVARHGSDELTVLVSDLPRTSLAHELAQRIEEACREPVALAGREVVVSCSIGVVVARGDELESERLISHAATAMHHAKQRGGARVEAFSAELERESSERAWLEDRLRSAIAAGEFHLVYQPQVDGSGARIGMEALLRWHPVDHTPVSPDEFIPLAEELGLIGDIGAWVLERACETAAAWTAPVCVCVNLSPCQLADPALPSLVAETLARTGLPARLLELELTETALIEQNEQAIERLFAVRRLGVRIALDDFGTGYSSLARLQQLPLDALKIDRSFIAEIGTGSGTDFVRTIIELGRILGLDVICEGVETGQQLAALHELGCDRMQGYLLGRPLPDPSSLSVGERDAA
jgi:diguanylate cyclase (GGDEF)-like protein